MRSTKVQGEDFLRRGKRVGFVGLEGNRKLDELKYKARILCMIDTWWWKEKEIVGKAAFEASGDWRQAYQKEEAMSWL